MELLPFNTQALGHSRLEGMLLHLDETDKLAYVAETLYKEQWRKFVGRDLIVVRPPVFIQHGAKPQSAHQAGIELLIRRFPLASIVLLSSQNYRLQLSRNLSKNTLPFRLEECEADLLSCIRQREMEHFVEEADALLPRNESYSYHLPSGAYAPSFLRVGNVQISTSVLDAAFFWLLPYLSEVDGILVDTWSISSLALNTGRRLAQYDPAKAGFRVEMLSHYHNGRPGTRKQLVAIAKRVSHGFQKPYLVLFSALMTGRSLRDVARTLQEDQGVASLPRFLVLYRLADSPFKLDNSAVPELCNFSPILQGGSGHSVTIKAPRFSVEIDSQTYFPVIVRERVQKIFKYFASRNKRFFDRYRRSAVVRIHADAHVGGHFYRHHGILIDVAQAVKEPEFEKSLAQILLENGPPHLMVIPPHPAGKALATLAAKIFEAAGQRMPDVFYSPDLAFNVISEREKSTRGRTPMLFQKLHGCSPEDSIIVLDDAVTTGRRLLTFQRRLRELNYKGRILYVVGVARMTSKSEWSSLKSTLVARDSEPSHQVSAVENILLPDWDNAECPWCQESRILDDIIKLNPAEVSQAMVRRAGRLRSSSQQGLTENVFLPGTDDRDVSFTQGSFFVDFPARPSAVVASVAATLQEMREDSDERKRLSPTGFPLRSVLGLADLDRYSDSMLRAAILRAATAAELRRTGELEENKRSQWARAILQDQSDDAKRLRRELLVAVLMHKLPRQTLDLPTLEVLRREGFREICDLIETEQL